MNNYTPDNNLSDQQSSGRSRRIVGRLIIGLVVVVVGLFVFAFISAWWDVRRGKIPPELLEQILSQGGFTAIDNPVAGNGSSIDPRLLYTDDDPAKGNPNAKIKIVEFSDFQCPFCRQAFPVIRELLEKYPNDIYFIYRDFPIDQIHPQARLAAEAGECAQDQGLFWPLHDQLFINQDKMSLNDILKYARSVGIDMDKFAQCLTSKKYAQEVEDDLQTGLRAGVKGTPTFFVNGQKIEGAVPLSVWEKIIESLIK